MSKNSEGSGPGRLQDRAVDETIHNPSAPSRRRLLKALGLGLVASQLSLDWQKPAIRFGALPAHAVSSPSGGCDVFYNVTFSSPGVYTAVITAGDNLVSTAFASTATGGGGTQSLSYSHHQGSSTYSEMGLHFTVSASGSLFFTENAGCCDTNTLSAAVTRTGTGVHFAAGVNTQDDGNCNFNK